MKPLDFPGYKFRFKSSENRAWIFDIIRKKFVILQPEEWVRQHVLHLLITEKNYPAGLINVEKVLRVHGLKKRYDVVAYDTSGRIRLLVECKSPEVLITQESFDQIARYNMELRAPYLLVTNGLTHFCCQMDYQKEKYFFLRQIPDFSR
jgi:hypothetical protein